MASLALKVNLPRRSGIYCIADLMKTAQVWRLPAVLKCASSSYLKEPARGDANSAVGARAGQVHCGTASLVVWSDAACRNQSIEGRCRMGYVIGLISASLLGPRHILLWAAKFTRKSVTSSLRGEAYAFRGMARHMTLTRELSCLFANFSPSMLGLEDW